MRRLMVAVATLGVCAAGLLVVPAAAATGPYCGQRWGSAPQHALGSASSLASVRAGGQPCFDRLVIDVNGPAVGYDVEYVSAVLTQGQGAPLALRGGAFLNVTMHGPAASAPANRAEVVNVTGFRTFRQVAFGGSFEGSTTFGLGVRARLPLRVFVLTGPGSQSRVVIDVGHQW
jgi:hypothetical protein